MGCPAGSPSRFSSAIVSPPSRYSCGANSGHASSAVNESTGAMIRKPKKVATRLGTFGELMYSISPKASDAILNTGYKLFPDSKAAKGEKDGEAEKAPSTEAVAFAHLLRGVHW